MAECARNAAARRHARRSRHPKPEQIAARSYGCFPRFPGEMAGAKIGYATTSRLLHHDLLNRKLPCDDIAAPEIQTMLETRQHAETELGADLWHGVALHLEQPGTSLPQRPPFVVLLFAIIRHDALFVMAPGGALSTPRDERVKTVAMCRARSFRPREMRR